MTKAKAPKGKGWEEWLGIAAIAFVAFVLVYVIVRALRSRTPTAPQGLVGGGSGGSQIVPFNPPTGTPPRPPSLSGNFGTGGGGGGSSRTNFGPDPRDIARAGGTPDIDLSQYEINAQIPYQPIENLPDSNLLSFTPGADSGIPGPIENSWLQEIGLQGVPDSFFGDGYTPTGIADVSVGGLDTPSSDSVGSLFDYLTQLDTSLFDGQGNNDLSQGAYDFTDPTEYDSSQSIDSSGGDYGGDYGDSGDGYGGDYGNEGGGGSGDYGDPGDDNLDNVDGPPDQN